MDERTTLKRRTVAETALRSNVIPLLACVPVVV
jgi:hypothetical protein